VTITISHPGGTTTVDAGAVATFAVTPIGGSGDYLVIWSGAHAQRYDAAGAKVGAAFSVEPLGTLNGFSATATSDGGFVLYRTYGQPGAYSAFAQRYSAAGATVGAETQLNSVNVTSPTLIDPITLSNGSTVGGWHTGTTEHLVILDASGAPVGGDITPDGDKGNTMQLTALPGGGFLAIWSAHHSGDFQQNIYAQRYDNSGVAVGGQIAVTTGIPNKQLPAATVLTDGSLVLVWGVLDYPNPSGVWAQKYTAAGVANGAAFQVNTTPLTASGLATPAVTALDNGGFAITWGLPNGGNPTQIFAQAFTAAGARSGAEILVGTGGSHLDLVPLSGAGFSVLWQDGGNHLQSTAILPTTVSPVLTVGIDLANGDGANDVFQAAPTTLNSGDKLDGGAGSDTLQQTAAGTLNFTGVTLTSIEAVTGSSGNDTFIFPKAPPAGMTLNSGGGADTLVVTGKVDLTTFTLGGNWTVKTTDGGSAVFTVSSLAQLGMIDGTNANVTVVATGLTLTESQILAAFAQGIDELRLADGLTVSRHGITQSNDAQWTVYNAPMASLGQWSAALPDGGYVTFYSASSSDGTKDFWVQRYDSNGDYVGDLFKIVDVTANDVLSSSSVVLTDGGYVLFWTTFSGGVGYDQHGQRFDSEGQKLGGEINLGHADFDLGGIYATATPDGGFVVSHAIAGNNGVSYPLLRYNNAGQLLSTTAGNGGQIQALADGGFVQVWRAQVGGDFVIYHQRFTAAGTAIGSPTPIPGGDAATSAPSVAALAGGGYAITWAVNWDGPQVGSVYAQSFNASGAATTAAILVNPANAGAGAVPTPTVLALKDGGFVVDWGQSINVNGQMTGFSYEQHFDAAGHRIGNEAATSSGQEIILEDGSRLFNWVEIDFHSQIHISDQQFVLYGDFHYLAEAGEVVFGSAGDTLVLAPAAKVGAAASLKGGAGNDTLQLVSAGVADLTAPAAFSGFEQIIGSSGDDTFLVSQARLAGVQLIDGGGGTNVIRLAAAGSLDLTTVELANIARIEGSSGADTLKGGGGDDVLKGGAGADVLNGGPGHDIALYSVASTAASWTHNGDGSWTVNAGADGSDTVRGVEVLRFTDMDVTLTVTQPAPSDFNLDGKSDVLWRNNSGELYVWNSQSGQGAFQGQTLGNPGTGWRVQDVGDYDGDGKADVLWRNDGGDLYIYRSDDGAAVTFTGQTIASVDPIWAVVPHAGDFDGDGRSDILFRNGATGEVYLWNSNTGADVSFLGQSLGSVGSNWSIKAVDDFNGDGKADVLWRSDAGDVYVWTAAGNGGAVSMNGQSISSVPNDWSILGAGDFNGDGRADILWRHAGDGELYVWNSQTGSAAVNFVGQSLGVVGLDWTVAAIGDYDGDGRADVLFRNADGRVYVWNSNDTGPVGFAGQGLGTTPMDWHILSDFHGM
jgi:hypothetical protein